VNLAACSTLPCTPENGVWFRVIQIAYLGTALSSAHTKKASSRFNPGDVLDPLLQYAALYFADDPMTAQFEVGALLGNMTPGGYVPHPNMSSVTLNVRVILSAVADLTDVTAAQIPLETTAQELTGDWKGYETRSPLTPVSGPKGWAPTHRLGMALFGTNIEGFRSVSARVPYQRTLTVFPDNLRRGSSLSFSDPGGTFFHRIDGTL
jgi:hypothetical protein